MMKKLKEDKMKKHKAPKTNAMRMLEDKNIDYVIHDRPWKEQHEEKQVDVSHLPSNIYKTLVAVGNQTGHLVACIPAKKEIDLKKLAKVSGNKKVEMLAQKDLEKVTGYVRGGCSPIAMKKLFPTYLDVDAKLEDSIIVSAGKQGLQLELKPDDLVNMTQAEYVDIAE